MLDYYGQMDDGQDEPPRNPDGQDDDREQQPGDEGGEDEDGEDAGGAGPTALIPKNLLGGKDFKPGDKVTLQIVRLYDDEAEVRYAPAKDKKPSAMDKADGALAAMAGGGEGEEAGDY